MKDEVFTAKKVPKGQGLQGKYKRQYESIAPALEEKRKLVVAQQEAWEAAHRETDSRPTLWGRDK